VLALKARHRPFVLKTRIAIRREQVRAVVISRAIAHWITAGQNMHAMLLRQPRVQRQPLRMQWLQGLQLC
jgi:hypothetical protein